MRGKVENDYADALAAQLEATTAIFTAKPTIKSEEAAPVTPEPEPVVVPETPAPTEPVTPAAPPPAEAPEGIDRMRFKTETDKLIGGMKVKHPDWSWAECEAAVNGPEVEPPSAQVDLAADELAQIEAALNAHAEAGDLPTPEIRKMQRREAELLAEQKAQALVAPLLAKEEERETKAFESDRMTSKKTAEGQFPSGYTEGSELNAQFKIEVENAMDANHPDYIPGIAGKVNAPEILLGRAAIAQAEKDAAAKGIPFGDAYAALKGKPLSATPQAKAAASITTPTPPVTPARKPSVTAPGNAGTRSPDRPATGTELEATLRSTTDIDELDRILRASHTATVNNKNGHHAGV